LKTAGRWSWKSKSSKKSVTTYLPNGPALKIDSAQIYRIVETQPFRQILKQIGNKDLKRMD